MTFLLKKGPFATNGRKKVSKRNDVRTIEINGESCVSVKIAAEILGVSVATMRRYADRGSFSLGDEEIKLKVYRNRNNNYRYMTVESLERLKKALYVRIV